MASYEEAYSLIPIIEKIKGWHHDRNLIEGATDKDQYMKLIQEAGELSDNICKGKDIRDDIGDMIVVMINIAERNNVTITECVLQAWNDIKDRKGRMVDGVFIKEEDDGITEEVAERYRDEWEFTLAEYAYDGTPVEYSEDGFYDNVPVSNSSVSPDYTGMMEARVPYKRAVGSLDGPGCDWDLENDPESTQFKEGFRR